MDWLKSFDAVDPDKLYKNNPSTITIFYVPQTDHLYLKRYPESHEDMLHDDEIFQGIYGDDYRQYGVQPDDLRSRGVALRLKPDLVAARLGLLRKQLVLSLWRQPPPEIFARFIAKLFHKHPEFRALESPIVVTGKGIYAKTLPELIGGKGRPNPQKNQAAVKAPLKTSQDTERVYELGGRKYPLSRLQVMRAALHTGDTAVDTSILSHPDMLKYPELKGYIPAKSRKNLVAADRNLTWNQASRDVGMPYLHRYGEFANWFFLQSLLD